MQRYMLVYVIMLASLAVYRVSLAKPDPPSALLEMKVKGVTMDPSGRSPIVILQASDGQQAFPIWIGMHEARAIALAMEGVPTPRPLTHLLLQNILTDLHIKVVRIVIHDLRHNTFYASIFLQQGPTTHTIDARPSDAIALALGLQAPIFVAPTVFEAVRTVTLSTPSQPASLAKKFGMHMQSLDAELASVFRLDSTRGVLIAFVEEGSLAERQGLRRGDVITSADGRPLQDMHDLLETFDRAVDQEIVLQVTRDHLPIMLRLRLSSLE